MDKALDEIISSRPRNARRGSSRRGTARAQVLGKPVVSPATRARAAAPANGAAAAQPTPADKIIVSNLPTDVNEGQIKELFTQTVGPLREVTLHYDSTGRSKGVAAVHFQRKGDGTKAFQQYNNRLIDGKKPMKIEIVVAPAPASLASRVAPAAAAAAPANNAAPRAGGGRAGRRGRGGKAGGARKEPRVAKSAADLDADMEDYTASNAPAAAPAAAGTRIEFKQFSSYLNASAMPSVVSASSTSLDEGPGLYAERPEWSDVTPSAQYEDANPIAPIFYSPEYKDATDYFRGIVKTGEKSERVLELTETIIRLNPAHYSAWQYRYETLLALKSPLDDELNLMDELAVAFLKTYQPERELAFIAASLKADTKNYHTWSYRQWLLAFFNDDGLWAGELDFVDSVLAQDVRNNSAWHHRFFVVFQSGLREGETDRGRIIRRELTFVKQNISLVANNPSAWNYLRGILDTNKLPYSRVEDFVKPYAASTHSNVTDLVDLENPPPSRTAQLPCPAAIEFLADIHEKEGGKDAILQATELWRSLADEQDTIRKKYWEYRIKEALKRA
ncbi:hypothetical protein DXG03_003322 [Asterophora parasitica]|uniref:Protein farnesyltransferase/geranylgeranyltransferase type-1 subunit alpha n=1 Tax=Asterophora parasitica TaxID=117018 RepID=A0A9P7G540_9AGAR|nr:hypothetical protein DXG03_003322 [Asterophora parasitica]